MRPTRTLTLTRTRTLTQNPNRRQELGFVGMDADQEGVLKALRRALVTSKEYAR